MITDPEGEQFWPGQSQQLYDTLHGPKLLATFTNAEEPACTANQWDAHCSSNECTTGSTKPSLASRYGCWESVPATVTRASDEERETSN